MVGKIKTRKGPNVHHADLLSGNLRTDGVALSFSKRWGSGVRRKIGVQGRRKRNFSWVGHVGRKTKRSGLFPFADEDGVHLQPPATT